MRIRIMDAAGTVLRSNNDRLALSAALAVVAADEANLRRVITAQSTKPANLRRSVRNSQGAG